MKEIVGILVVISVLFIFNLQVGTDVVVLAIVTLCLWHGLWRLIDHFEKVLDAEDKPLISAIVSISVGAVLAFCINRFRPDESVRYLEKRF